MSSGVFVNFNGTSVLQLMSFFLLMYLLIKFLYKPFLAMVDKRSAEIRSEYGEAGKARKEAEELKKKSEIQLQEFNDRVSKMYDEAKDRVKKYETSEKKQVQSDVESIMEKARREISEEQLRAEETLKAKVVALVVALASRLIQKDLDEKSKREFLMSQLSKLGDDREK